MAKLQKSKKTGRDEGVPCRLVVQDDKNGDVWVKIMDPEGRLQYASLCVTPEDQAALRKQAGSTWEGLVVFHHYCGFTHFNEEVVKCLRERPSASGTTKKATRKKKSSAKQSSTSSRKPKRKLKRVRAPEG